MKSKLIKLGGVILIVTATGIYTANIGRIFEERPMILSIIR